jgi:hypothetical protein
VEPSRTSVTDLSTLYTEYLACEGSMRAQRASVCERTERIVWCVCVCVSAGAAIHVCSRCLEDGGGVWGGGSKQGTTGVFKKVEHDL